MQKEERILLDNITQLFLKYGIKSLTMDDIASHLGISKKTLYQYVRNKKDLVKKCVSAHVKDTQCKISEIEEEEKINPIDKLVEISKKVNSQMNQTHPSLLFDLKKYHPESWEILQKHKEEFISSNVHSNLVEGIEQGFYRSNINPEIITKLYISMVSNLMETDNLNIDNVSFSVVHQEMMRYHVRGIATAEGRKYLKEKFNENE